MKRSLLILVIFTIFISGSLMAQVRDYKGQSWASGQLGYAVGSGDAFTSYTEPLTNAEYSFNADYGFGGQFYYGVKENVLIGGELLFQRYTAEVSVPTNLSLGITGYSMSESTTKTNVIFNTLWGVNQTRTSDLFLMGGTGLYDFGGTELGFNSGLFWRKEMSNNWHLFGMPRVHVVMADSTPIMFQFTLGAQFSI